MLKKLEIDKSKEVLRKELALSVQELETFAYSVSHDLRAPLRTIKGFSEILLQDHSQDLNEDGQRLVKIICDDVAKMDRLIEGLLLFSTAGVKEMVKIKIDMTDLVRRCFKIAKEKFPAQNVKIQVETLPSAEGDISMINQVVLNLLSNAIKFTRFRDDPAIEVTAKRAADYTVYSIKDNGVGFDSRFKDKLFTIFQRLHSTTEFEGSGVGLALVKKIINRHEGEVSAESQLNKGATFSFSMPNSIVNEAVT